MEEEKLEREYRNLFKTRSAGQGRHRREVWAVLGVKTQSAVLWKAREGSAARRVKCWQGK